MSAIDELSLKFTTGNCIPVDRTIVTRDEWLAVVAEAEQLRERCKYLQQAVDGEFPEGCTPADARMLRVANHGLADENARLRARIDDAGSGALNGFYQYMICKTASVPVGTEDNQRGSSTYNWYRHFSQMIFDYMHNRANQIEGGE